jgi:hypothetical protein
VVRKLGCGKRLRDIASEPSGERWWGIRRGERHVLPNGNTASRRFPVAAFAEPQE